MFYGIFCATSMFSHNFLRKNFMCLVAKFFFILFLFFFLFLPDCFRMITSERLDRLSSIVFQQDPKLCKGAEVLAPPPPPHSNMESHNEWFYAGPYSHTLFRSISYDEENICYQYHIISYRTFHEIHHSRYAAIRCNKSSSVLFQLYTQCKPI